MTTTTATDDKAIDLNRRVFLKRGVLGATALGMTISQSCATDVESPPRFPLIGFTKPFQELTAEQTAELVATAGWDGVEIPVRAKGQIEPEHAPDELPRYAELLRARRLDIHIVTTDITSLSTPHAETVLQSMAKLGIKRLRLGFFIYTADKSPTERLKEIAPALRDIADACCELDLQAGFQNHSGAQFVGAPVWDVYSIIRDLDPKHIGFCFDIGHASLEGGLSWPTESRLVEPFLTAVFVKDFVWKKEVSGWKDIWCPLGEGMVNRAFFDWLKKSNYRGPISQHHEYNVGEGSERIAKFQRDLKVLKEWLK
ncbi:MAG: sugar phosphate isomerase/epimerase family protein [Planctomycetaceae bacterium]